MYKYVIKRILLMIPVLLGISFVVFFLMDLTPGTPADIIMGDLATSEAKAALNESLGWNRPFIQRFLDYIMGVFRGDFGSSYVSGLPVFEELFSRFPTTFQLALYSMILASLIGIPLGIACAVKQYSLLDTIPSVLSFFIAAIPSFVLGMVLLLVFAQQLKILPSYGLDTWKHYIMPILAIAIPPAAQNMRFTKSSMLEAIRQDYVRTARPRARWSAR